LDYYTSSHLLAWGFLLIRSQSWEPIIVFEYAENMEKWEKFDKEFEMNNAEMKYYTDATIRIEKMLMDVAH